jgi:hypothetical protein
MVAVGRLVLDGTEMKDGMEIPGLGKASVDVPGKLIKVDKIMRINNETIDGLIAGASKVVASGERGARLARPFRRSSHFRAVLRRRAVAGSALLGVFTAANAHLADVAIGSSAWSISSTSMQSPNDLAVSSHCATSPCPSPAGEVHCLVGENGSGKSTPHQDYRRRSPTRAGRAHRD